MCRWIVWLSHPDAPVLLADVDVREPPLLTLLPQLGFDYKITKAQHNLVLQATQHQQGLHIGDNWEDNYGYPQNSQTNIDGWGLGWYSILKSRQAHSRHIVHGSRGASRLIEVDLPLRPVPRPAVFRSIMPILHDINVKEVVENVESHCVFGHIRAGTPLALENSHPFKFGRFLFQHNGYYRPFWRVQADILMHINELGYNPSNYIKGSTDSEHIAALFFFKLSIPDKWEDDFDIIVLAQALRATIDQLFEWSGPYRRHSDGSHDNVEYASINISITDGEQLLALCYAAPEFRTAGSLYYSTSAGPHLSAAHLGASTRHLIVASERSTLAERDWTRMKNGDLLMVGRYAFDERMRRAQGQGDLRDRNAWGKDVAGGRWIPKVVRFDHVELSAGERSVL